MRTVKDRIRHTLAFQIIGLLTFAPLASLVFGFEMHLMGAIAIVASITATIWNYIYNLLFDHALFKRRQNAHKTLALRVLHAFCLKLGYYACCYPLSRGT